MIREGTGVDSMELRLDERGETVDAIAHRLAAERGADWGKLLLAPNTLFAVNREIVQKHHRVNDGDELAFFPPVTGG